MDLIKQWIEALEPFARHFEYWSTFATLEDRALPRFIDEQRAAEALVALRKAEAEREQGFEEWWSEHRYPKFCSLSKECARAVYRAGQLASIPPEIREALVEACRESEHGLQSEAAAYLSRCTPTDSAKAAGCVVDATRIAKARAWLEGK